jgi:hypothetical protein
MSRKTRPLSVLAVAVSAACLSGPAAADEAALAARIEQMQAEINAMKVELQKLNAAKATPPAVPAAAAPSAAAATASTAAAAASALAAQSNATGALTPLPDQMAPSSPYATNAPTTSPLTVFGYGELNYEIYPRNRSQNQIDLARAVIGFGYRFDGRTRFVGEFEWEHAVTSADDAGEVAVEQFYVERTFTPSLAGKAGLFLIPSGLLNVNHEPTQYFGVTRNFVETQIIPTTWREAGLSLAGLASADLSWDVGITTGFNLSAWDPNSDDGKFSPLGSIHQEGQLARAANLSAYGALNWRGTPGLLVGGSVFAGKAGQAQPNFLADNAVVTLTEAHARWTPGDFDLSALYAWGHITDTAAYNLSVIGSPTPIPQDFFGWYLQGAWYAWRSGDYQLAPFARYEQVNTGWRFASLGAGITPSSLPTEGITTVGANFYVTPNIVFKADYQWFRTSNLYDRFQLGLGVNF